MLSMWQEGSNPHGQEHQNGGRDPRRKRKDCFFFPSSPPPVPVAWAGLSSWPGAGLSSAGGAAAAAPAGVEASGLVVMVNAALRSSEAWAQSRALVLGWNWARPVEAAREPSWVRGWCCLKWTWALLWAVKSQDENNFSSKEGPEVVVGEPLRRAEN